MTEPPRAALERFLARLDAGVSFAVAKQPDLWGNLRRGGDWDLVVPDLRAAHAVLEASLGRPRRVVRRSYVVANFYDWGEIDLLPRLEWKGVELVSAMEVIAGASRSAEGWPVARLAHQAVAGWLYPLLAYGSFAERYGALALRAHAEDRDELAAVLGRLFGARADDVLAGLRAQEPVVARRVLSRLRLAARRRAVMRRPLGTVRAVVAFAGAELALR